MTEIRPRQPKPIMTYTLIGFCVLVYLVDRFSSLALTNSWGYGLLSVWGMRINREICEGEWWRLLTSIFLHGSELHLGMNCLALYIWGRYLERWYGPWRYGLLLLAAGFMGNLLGFAFSSYNALGISGAVFGIFGMLLALWKENRKLFNAIFGVQVFIYAGMNLVMGFMNTGVDNWGHIGGLLGGFLAGMVLGLPWTQREKVKQTAAGLAYISVSVFLFAVGKGVLF